VIAEKRGKVKALPEGEIKELTQKLERTEGAGAGQSRTPLPRDQESVWFSESQIQGTTEEHRPAARTLRTGELGARKNPIAEHVPLIYEKLREDSGISSGTQRPAVNRFSKVELLKPKLDLPELRSSSLSNCEVN